VAKLYEVLEPHMIDVSEPVPEGLTREVYYTIKVQFKGDMNKVVEAWRLGNTPNLAKLKYTFEKKAVQIWLFQPKSFDILADGIKLAVPNGYTLYISKDKLMNTSVDDLVNICSNYVLAQVKCESKKAWALKVQILKAKEDMETAKQICEQVPPILALTAGLGWQINWELVRLSLVRFTGNIKLFGDGIIPIIQLTLRGTGKTTHAIWCQEVLGYGYVSKIPTLARLIMDARTGQFGLVYKNGIIFDEFTDLSTLDKARAQEIIDVIKTGLSHGIWTRETATPRAVSPVVEKYLPFIWYGNCDEEPMDARQWLVQWLRRQVGIQGADAVADRFAIIDVVTHLHPQVASMLTFKCLRASVMRGILAYVRRQAESKPLDEYMKESTLQGRQKLYAVRVRAVFEALLSTPEDRVVFDQKEVDEIVAKNYWGEVEDFIREVVKAYV